MIKPASREHKLVEVPVLLDRERLLRLDSYAMECILEKTGKNILRGEFIPKNFNDFAVFIWACAQTDATEPVSEGGAGSPLDLETVLKTLFIHQFQQVVEVVTSLMGDGNADPNVLAPYVPSDLGLVIAALKMAELKEGETFWDLGCGDGRALAVAARMKANVYGVENEPNRAKLAASLLKRQGVPEGHLITGLIQETDFSGADVIFTYLQTNAYKVLAPVFLKILKPGTRVLSHDFPILKWTPIKSLNVRISGDERPHSLFLYEIGKSEIERAADGVLTDTEAEVVSGGIADQIDQYFELIKGEENA